LKIRCQTNVAILLLLEDYGYMTWFENYYKMIIIIIAFIAYGREATVNRIQYFGPWLSILWLRRMIGTVHDRIHGHHLLGAVGIHRNGQENVDKRYVAVCQQVLL
jgi:hypothetical protein